MSSLLRSLQTPAGYFVMSGETVLDGSGYGFYDLSADTVFNNNGSVSAAARLQFNPLFKDTLFDGDDATTGSVTLKDLGKTIYGGSLHSEDAAGVQGVSDMRKVSIASGASAGVNVDKAFYVTLGTNLRNPTPAASNGYVSSLKPSVALVGKLL